MQTDLGIITEKIKDEQKIYAVCWQKLIKKKVERNGKEEFVKGFMIVFETIFGTSIYCWEIDLKDKVINEKGNIVQPAEFGEALQLETTYEFEHRYNDLLEMNFDSKEIL